MAMMIPPGGFAGFSQMTPASRVALTQGVRSNGNGAPRRRRRKGKRAKTAKRARKSGRKIKFGSPAWRKKYKLGKKKK